MLRRWLISLALPTTPAANLPAFSPAQLAELGQLACQHSVLPAVLRHLPAVGTEFRTQHMQTTARSMLLRLWQDKIIVALRQQSIPVIVLKGSEFADRLYPEPALRWFTDIDLMVPQTFVTLAGEVVRELGFEHVRGSALRHGDAYGEVRWQSVADPKFGVEIHWNLVNSPAVQRGVSVRYEDLQLDPTGRLSAASLLLIAAVHAAASHVFDRLGLLVDLRQAATGAAGQVDEEFLLAVAQRTGARLALLTGLHLAYQLWGDEACARLRDRLPRRATDNFALSLITPSVVLGGESRLAEWRRRLYRELLKRR